MNTEQAAVQKLAKLGWAAAFENCGNGACEIVAYSHEDEELYYAGPIQGALEWVNKQKDVGVSSYVEEEDDWDAKYGDMTDEDVQKALAQEKLDEQRELAAAGTPPTQEEEEPEEEEAVAEPVAVVPTNTQKEKKENGKMSLIQKLLGKDVVDIPAAIATDKEEAPALTIARQVQAAAEEETTAKAIEAFTTCKVALLDYQDARLKISTNRRVRIFATTESYILAYDIGVYNDTFEELAAEAPAGTPEWKLADRARLAAKRMFKKSGVLDIRVSADAVAPLNPGVPEGTAVVRPITDEGVKKFGPHPRVINSAAAQRYLDNGWELIPAGQ